MRARSHRVERMDERVAARVLVERVDEASVCARRPRERRALHHPAALRAVGDRAGQQSVGVEVVRTHEVAVEIRRRDMLDQEEPACVGREGVEGEVALERDRLVAERLRIDDLKRRPAPERHRERRLAEDECAAVAREPTCRAVVGDERDAPAAGDIAPAEYVAVVRSDRLEHGRFRAGERDVADVAGRGEEAVASLVDAGRGSAVGECGGCEDECGEQRDAEHGGLLGRLAVLRPRGADRSLDVSSTSPRVEGRRASETGTRSKPLRECVARRSCARRPTGRRYARQAAASGRSATS